MVGPPLPWQSDSNAIAMQIKAIAHFYRAACKMWRRRGLKTRHAAAMASRR
jgi:hypothetical protein